MITTNTPSVSQNLTSHFPQYSFLQKFENKPYIMHHVFDKEFGKHRILHTIDITEIPFEIADSLVEKINLTKDLKHPNLLTCSHAERDQLNVHLAIDENNLCPLSDILDGTRLSFKKTLEIGIQICAAIEHLHTNGVTHEGIDESNVLLDREYFTKINPPYFQYFLNLSIHKNKEATLPDGNTFRDLRAVGKLMLRMITGYQPQEISREHWKRFGVNDMLAPVIEELIKSPKEFAKWSISDVMSELENIQSSIYEAADILPSCQKARENRLKLTERWKSNTLKGTIEDKGNNETKCNLEFKERFEIHSCVLLDIAETIFEASDLRHKGEPVWLHIFDKNSQDHWDKNFNDICTRLTSIDHPNIAQVYDSDLLEDTAFITTHFESGERLSDFIQRHTFTPSELIDLSQQLLKAVAEAARFGFYNYHLTTDTITVYKTPEGKYHYRIITPGYSSLLELTDTSGDYISALLDPRTLAPELYEREPQKATTTQYIIGSILFKVATGYHPCEILSIDEAYKHNSSYCKFEIISHRSDIPYDYQEWLNTLLEANPAKRFKKLKDAETFLEKAAISFPIE